MEFHPLANEYPMMGPKELGRMEEGMRLHGFDKRFPILVFQDKILDGRNRFSAAAKAGVEPEFKQFRGTEEEARAFVQRANEERRHLTQEFLQQRRQERVERVAAARAQGESLRAIAEREGVSEKTIREDVRSAGPAAEPAEVTGKDGKTYDQGKPRQARPKPGTNGAAEKPAGAPPAPVDNYGNELPKRCRDAYADPFLQETIDYLGVSLTDWLARRVASRMNKKAKHFPFYNAPDFVDGCAQVGNVLEQLLEHMKEFRPAGVCPLCGGKGCAECRMSGLLPAKLYKELKARAKAEARAEREREKAGASS